MLARRAQAFAFQRTAGAHRQLVEHFVAAFRRGERSVRSHQHARLVIVAFGDGQRSGGVVDIVIDGRRIERRRHTGAVAVVELGIECTLRVGRHGAPGQQGAADRRHADKGRQHLLHGGLCGKR